MTVGDSSRCVTRCAATSPHSRSGPGKSGAPSYRTSRARGAATRDRPRAHHPAEVGEPEQGVATPEIELVGEVLRALDREAPVDVDGALRPPGRTRGVDQHVGRLGIDVLVGELRRLAVDGLVPPSVASSRPRYVQRGAGAPNDEHPSHRRRRRDRLVRDRLEPDPRAAPEEPIRGDEHGGLAVGQPSRDRRRRVPAEDRGVRWPRPARRRAATTVSTSIGRDPDPVTGPNAMGVRVSARRDPRHRPAPGSSAFEPPVCLPGDRAAIRIALARGDGGPGVVERATVHQRAQAGPARPGRAPRAVASPL